MQIKLLVYGEPGVGKTTLLASGADDERLWPGLLLDFEGGTLAIRSKVRQVAIEDLVADEIEPEEERLDVVRITEWDDFQAIYEYLVAADPFPYQLVGIDSLSEVNVLCLDDVVLEAARKSASHAEDVVELQDYGKNSIRMKRLVRGFRDLPCHVAFTAGVQTSTNPKTKLQQTQPDFTGKLVWQIAGLVDIVGLLTREPAEDEVHRILQTAPTDSWVAKDRSEGGMLGGEMVNPTLPKILDALEID